MNESLREAVVEALGDSVLLSKLERYLGKADGNDETKGRSIAEIFQAGAKQVEADRFVVPVVGMVKAGKSTFLNGLIFGKPVLPIDADETTAVPCEIVYREGDGIEARVYFREGGEERVDPSEDGLRPFVHNEDNPGNEKGVERIVLKTDHRLLRDGLVLVDLPGVGTITKANVKTTEGYLEESVGMVYLLRTVPPLTMKESGFLARFWPLLPEASFVQNRWTDESPAEVEDGREHNVEVLRRLAESCRVPLEGEPRIDVVCAYRAYEGALTGDAELVAGSGVASFEERLEGVAFGWRDKLARTWGTVVVEHATSAEVAMKDRLQNLERDEKSARREMDAEKKRADQYLAKLQKRSESALDEVGRFERKTSKTIRDWQSRSKRNIRNEMRTVMRGGVVDGPNLTKALRDNESDTLDALHNDIQERSAVAHGNLVAFFEGVEVPVAARPSTVSLLRVASSRKYESAAKAVGGVAGGLGGMAGGAKVCGLIGGAVGGPIGVAIGVVVGGVAGGLLGSWLGNKARDQVTHYRASSAEPEVFAHIDEFTSETAKQLRLEIQNIAEQLEAVIDENVEQQREALEKQRAARLEDLEAPVEERQRRKDELKRDLEWSKTRRAALEVVLHDSE